MKELLSPKQVGMALGVSEASLKRWCDKGLIPVIRTAGGHRRLPINAVIQFIRSSGHEVVRPEILGLPPATGKTESTLKRVRELMRQSLEAGDEEQARRLAFNLYLAGHKIHEICDEILAGCFYDIGDRWSHGETEVYEERRGVEICMRLLYQLRQALPMPPSSTPIAIGATLSPDPYTIPTTMAELTLCEAGWQAQSYGIGHPPDTLQAAIRQVKPRLFWLSVSAIGSPDEFVDAYTRVQQTAAEHGAAIVIGGRALTPDIRQRIRYGAFCDTMQHLADFGTTLLPRESKSETSEEQPMSDEKTGGNHEPGG